METENLQVLPLHKHPEYLQTCCELINDEWPRSLTARMMSLQASCDNLPTSLILVNDKKSIFGHCKLTPIPSLPESCFIETVVISKAMRGKKLGTYLMKFVENYCKNVLELKMVHLSTKGQENFYAKLGYKICAPVSLYGICLPNNIKTSINNKVEMNLVPVHHNTQTGPPPPPPPRPPPPPPPNPTDNLQTNNSTVKTNKTYMYKNL